MNTLKKLGLTALATTLVASSAFAGSTNVTVTGDAGFTWSQEEDGDGGTVDGIGYDGDYALAASGELDNGWSVSSKLLITQAVGLSSGWVSLTMGSMGNIVVGNGYGGLGEGFDGVTPTAYEEAHDGMGTATAIDSIGSTLDNGQIFYKTPTFDVGGGTVQIGVEYAPEASDAAVNDGTVSTSSNLWSSGKGAMVKIGYGGLSAGAYVNEKTNDAGTGPTDGDASDATWFANYTMGPVSFGYQVAAVEAAIGGAAAANNSSAKTVAAANGMFESEQMSIAFNVNENFSVSWMELTETYDEQDDGTVGDVDMDATAINFAYTMGSMSIKGYQVDTDNPGWDSDAKSDEVTELAINFSF